MGHPHHHRRLRGLSGLLRVERLAVVAAQAGQRGPRRLCQPHDGAVKGDLKNVGSLSEGLIKDYPSTVFAPLGALLSAQADYAASDAAAAEKRLEWVATQDKYPEYQTLARYRLAGIQLDKKDYDAAIATLEAAKPNSTERQLVDSRLGDVYAAKGDLKKAREYWKKTADDAKTTSAMKQYALLRLSTTRAE